MLDMSVPLLPDKYLEMQQLTLFVAETKCSSLSGHVFLGKANFCVNRHEELHFL